MRTPSTLSALALVACIGAAQPARAQMLPTADQLVARYLQRIGGADRLRAVQSVRRHGKYYGGGGFEAVVTNENRRPNMVREEFTFGGMTESRYSFGCFSNSSQQGMLTTRTFTPSDLSCSYALTHNCTSLPLLIRMTSGVPSDASAST